MATQLELFPTPDPPPGGGFISAVTLKRDTVADWDIYPFNIPAVRNLTTLPLHRAVTFLVGENGSGKSTLLEAVAVRLGYPAEGGSRNYRFSTRDTHSPEETDAFRLTREFLRSPERMMQRLFADEES